MADLQSSDQRAATPPRYFDARAELAYRFLAGEGLEIGALHRPLTLPPQARARYVDRMAVEELIAAYDEDLAGKDLTPVDVVDDGETLGTVDDASQDFIVANHFLEHTGDPIGTIGNHLAKLKPGGVLFYTVPDQRYTFDFRREVTTLEHLIRDHDEGPEVSRREHYDEWGVLVNGTEEERALPSWPQKGEEIARLLEDQDYSIHHHVWTESAFLILLLHCQECLDESFSIEALARSGEEIVVILRKAGAYPEPATDAPPVARLAAEVAALRSKVARLESAERELERVKRSSSWRVTEPLRAAKARLGGRR
ncbi:MAG: methyltransferase domain-containing protein [Actinobacteria bacterium]|nr:methyltransferase domain-containing protein [Actinomycetota bacterium]